MVGALSFLQPYLCIQPPLQSPPKLRSPTSAIFYLPVPPLLVHKIICAIPINTPFLYTSAIFHIPIFAHRHPYKSPVSTSCTLLKRINHVLPSFKIQLSYPHLIVNLSICTNLCKCYHVIINPNLVKLPPTSPV